MICPHCHKPIPLSLAARELRLASGSGRRKLPRACPKCGGMFGAREMRKHIPTCKATALQS